MNLGKQSAFFCIGAALAGILFSPVAAILVADLSFWVILIVAPLAGLFSLLSVWIGFAAASLFNKNPHPEYCGYAGFCFGMISVFLLPFVIVNYFEIVGMYFSYEYFALTPPLFAFVASLATKSDGPKANPPLNTDARQETPRAG